MATTGAQKKPPAAATSVSQDKQELFEAKYGEFLAEARGEAREFGADVHAVAFRPGGGGAVVDNFRGIGPRARAQREVKRLLARDVSAMGAAEVTQHAAQLQALSAAVLRRLREEEEKTMTGMTNKAAAAAAARQAVKRAPEQQGTIAGGKIRRIE